MKQTINYAKIDPAKQAEKAIADARFYNPKGMEVIEAHLKHKEIKTRRDLHFFMGFIGVQGYPVEALADLYELPKTEDNDEGL